MFPIKNVTPTDGCCKKVSNARLVARGSQHLENLDCCETFASVVKFTSIKVLLALVTLLHLQFYQMEVKTAFLNWELEQNICMEVPDGIEVKGKGAVVCKLLKSSYGSEQAWRCRNWKFNEFLGQKLSYSRSAADLCIYVRKPLRESQSLIALFVDDPLLAANGVDVGSKNSSTVVLKWKTRLKRKTVWG